MNKAKIYVEFLVINTVREMTRDPGDFILRDVKHLY